MCFVSELTVFSFPFDALNDMPARRLAEILAMMLPVQPDFFDVVRLSSPLESEVCNGEISEISAFL